MALFLFIAQREVPVINASMLEAIVPLQIFVIGLCCGRRVRCCSSRGWRPALSAVCWCCAFSPPTASR